MGHPWRRKAGIVGLGIIALGLAPRAAAAASDDAAAAVSPLDDSDLVGAADTLDLTALQGRFETIAEKASASVVSISAADNAAGGPPAPASADSDEALRAQSMNPQRLQDILDQTTRTVGTGFVIDNQGFILTNEHVVAQAEELWITTSDHKVWPAVVVGSDPRADLAVLKTPATGLAAVKFARAQQFHRGQWTIALGNPYGLATDGQSCMSVGVISATDRSLRRLGIKEDRLYSGLLQTTAQINPGNSGGPLLDIEGNVIGVNTAVIFPQKLTNGIGFAIPITPRLLAEAKELEQGHEIVYGYLGATVADPTAHERQAADVAEDVGVRLEETEENSPAAAVLAAGDYLTAFGGQTIHSTDDFIAMVGDATVGRRVPVDVVRGGKKITVSIIPARRKLETTAVTLESQRLHWRGMVLGGIPAGWQDSPDKPKAGLLVVRVEDNCPLKDQGVHPGSVITAVGDRRVGSLVELLNVINEVPPGQCTVKLAGATTRPAN